MTDNRREQIYEIIKREFIGPDPLDNPDRVQENGEEILSGDPPHIRYIAGVLYPQETDVPSSEITDDEVSVEDADVIEVDFERGGSRGNGKIEVLEDAEELINLSNSFKPAAMSVTVAVKNNDKVTPVVNTGVYTAVSHSAPETNKRVVRYLRHQLDWNNDGQALILPEIGMKRIPIEINGSKTKLCFSITHRSNHPNYSIYTFTLENTNVSAGKSVKDEDCFFQAGFKLLSVAGFQALPDDYRITHDEDFNSNCLLYRNIRSYAIGHGCSAGWDVEQDNVFIICTEIFPRHEIKPVIPAAIDGVSLEMLKMSDYGDTAETISELERLCNKYHEWIENGLKTQITNEMGHETTYRHIKNCEDCLARMKDGVNLLKSDANVLKAFQLMNRAMLLQQLHYNLPLQNWVDDGSGNLVLDKCVALPVISDKSTWHGDASRYGKWRPFQLAFILINLNSMADRTCSERSIVDLIWFPTGGGKTEAYLGLSAFTIFIRRIGDRNNGGTTILMRYTLRLLTAQQYERASAMICACESIRSEDTGLLGDSRVTIGLWVGGDTTPNKMKDAVDAYDKLYSGYSNINPFVMLKCPWCGAQMGVVGKGSNQHETPGYKKKGGKRKTIVFQCKNNVCDYSNDNNPLPLSVVDEEIYEYPPTLLLGTVDKFAMLPYRPEAKKIFGLDNKGNRVTAPDLIIQDELHLISGPLGSMVGHYETLIHELCTNRAGDKVISPKIISSTATISRAKEQCHALYACGMDNVKQFPPSGINASDSFFAVEGQNMVGRQYVGILASGSTSVATTTIRLYAALLYAAKAINVSCEDERDPYWTNIGYFNSIRELGQTETWIKQDIDEYLHIIYKRRREDTKDEYKNRRYIYREEELTSRIRSDKIPFSLQNLGISYPSDDKRPVDICLATNMISVGVDVPRLGLMCVSGQPKTTSEYIQATSRVGRSSDAPGLVFVLYNPGKPRDKSHYEHFKTYHSKIYCHVEPTSVTPFSPPLRERALHAIVIGLLRMFGDDNFNSNPPKLPSNDKIDFVKKIISERIQRIEKDELLATLYHIDSVIEDWKAWTPAKFHDFTGGNELPLMFQAGILRNSAWGKRGFSTPMSMRNVDVSCEVYVLENRYFEEG